MDSRRLEVGFFISLLLLVLALTIYVLWPYIGAIVLALTFSVVFRPLFARLQRVVGFDWLAAALTVLAVVLLVFIPLSYFGFQIFQQATTLYAHLTSGAGDNIGATLTATLRDFFGRFDLPQNSLNINEYIRTVLNWLIENLGPLFSGLTQVFVTLIISLFGLYYLLRDGEYFKKTMISLLPLEPRYAERIFAKMEQAVISVIRGQLAIALIQGAVAGIGFSIFGIPNAIFWGSFAAIAALVPTLGTAIIIFPAIVYLFFIGHAFASLGLLIWGIFAVGLIDNMLAPQLMRRGIEIHPFIILLSVLGGISVFGPMGFLVGPLVIALFYALLDIYSDFILAKR